MRIILKCCDPWLTNDDKSNIFKTIKQFKTETLKLKIFMRCRATQEFFFHETRDGVAVDADWRCRSCGLYAADHPAGNMFIMLLNISLKFAIYLTGEVKKRVFLNSFLDFNIFQHLMNLPNIFIINIKKLFIKILIIFILKFQHLIIKLENILKIII